MSPHPWQVVRVHLTLLLEGLSLIGGGVDVDVRLVGADLGCLSAAEDEQDAVVEGQHLGVLVVEAIGIGDALIGDEASRRDIGLSAARATGSTAPVIGVRTSALGEDEDRSEQRQGDSGERKSAEDAGAAHRYSIVKMSERRARGEAKEETKVRCAWAENDPLMRAYHDQEWGVAEHDSRMLWETLMLEGFQAGLAWITVLRKRETFREAFAGFDPEKVARFGEKDILRLMQNPGIIRARAKIEATIGGAKIYCEMAGTR